MTRDEVISLAREVFDVETDSRGRETFSGDSYGIERFAELVAAAERKVIMDSLQKQADLATDALDRRWALEMIAAVAARSKE